LVNSQTSDFKGDRSKLVEERKKNVKHCLDLECKNEQLKILIEKLNKLAGQRENLNKNNKNPRVFSEEIDQLYLKNSSILVELTKAKDTSIGLEKNISDLKSRIQKIDKLLSDI
jgi:hypothetical protein